MKVSVSILSEKENYKEAIYKLNNTNADYLHLDIMDGSFTNNKTFSIVESNIISKLINKKLDVHIMSTNLDKIIDEYLSLNPDIITFHIENDNIDKYICKIKEKNTKVGLAINPDTNINIIDKYLDKVDLILIMSVMPGLGGQSFIDVTDKVKYLKQSQNKYNYLIEIDGGINSDTINIVRDYVDIVVSGSYITSKDDYQSAIDSLK